MMLRFSFPSEALHILSYYIILGVIFYHTSIVVQAVFQDKDVIGSDDEGVPGSVFVHYLCSILHSIIAFLLSYGFSQIN